MNKKYKLVGSLIAGVALATMITGCAKDVECNIEEDHVHLYKDPDLDLSKYVESEKDHIGRFLRTDEYLDMTEELSLVSKKGLYLISDNKEYFYKAIDDRKENTREAYVYDYIYGSYYGYSYGYNSSSGKYEYFYGRHTGYHYGYEWQEISKDIYTSDEVRDITYTIKVYKIENGLLMSNEFNNVKDIPSEYKYFGNDIIVKHTSEGYYLDNNNMGKKLVKTK